MEKTIMHIDYDSFFASVEQQANPTLRNKPIAVTGSSISRGIVCAASYPAKRMGVKTGMPIYKAKEACPELLLVKGDFEKYQYIHDESLSIFARYTDLIEPLSIDEAFLDVTNTLNFFEDAQNLARKIKTDIYQAFGQYVTCSIGIAPNKLLAKVASDLNKPDGMFVITPNNTKEVLASLSLRAIPGIGAKIEQRLGVLGIHTMRELQNVPLSELYKHFGYATGSFLSYAAKGISYGNVHNMNYRRTPKSIGHQHTLEKNTKDRTIIRATLQRLARMVGYRLRNNNMYGKRIHVVARNQQKSWSSESIKFHKHTNCEQDIYKCALAVLEKMRWNDETRLLGITITDLLKAPFVTPELFSQTTPHLSRVLDTVNKKYGPETLKKAATLKTREIKLKTSSFLSYQ